MQLEPELCKVYGRDLGVTSASLASRSPFALSSFSPSLQLYSNVCAILATIGMCVAIYKFNACTLVKCECNIEPDEQLARAQSKTKIQMLIS